MSPMMTKLAPEIVSEVGVDVSLLLSDPLLALTPLLQLIPGWHMVMHSIV